VLESLDECGYGGKAVLHMTGNEPRDPTVPIVVRIRLYLHATTANAHAKRARACFPTCMRTFFRVGWHSLGATRHIALETKVT
jgi:hypothetical protein